MGETMQIAVSEILREVIPSISLGIIEATVVVEKSTSDLSKIIDTQLGKILENYSLNDLQFSPEITTVRDAYRKLGKDPTRYRGSAEALIRRVLQGKRIYNINNIVDINNLVSIETLHPVGSYDLNNIKPPIVLGIGDPGDSYKGIGKDEVNIARLPVFKDMIGPYGSPTADSERTKITQKTKHIMMVIISFNGSGVEPGLMRAIRLLEDYASANICDTILIS